ncbi:DUF4397 domain-containing protein [Tellurirhabdus bombi]|uniref:DUF4397 domain-containing protein n=1 Tax=Tellurirhabdus bombi TaxID=2907205 RepID=UPI001F3CA2D9|nr:DUF4397 domain-containing protein [Tellurirhabdus bombi]
MFKPFLYSLLVSILFFSCEKNALKLPVDPIAGGARVKLIHAAPDTPGIDLYIGTNKFSAFTPTGASTTSSGTPTGLPYTNTFPGSVSGYAIATPGATSLSITAPATTTATSATAIGSLDYTLEDNKYYSVFVAGPGAKPEVFVLNDDFSMATDPTKYYVRFVNLTPGVNYDVALVTSSTTATVLAPNIAYKGATNFIPVDAATSPSFVLRQPGSATNLGPAVSFTSNIVGRVITVYTRGVAGRTGAAAPGISIYANR